MKKTRLLASLLCVMMVLTMIPMMALAAPSAAELNAAGQALGAASIKPTANAVNYEGIFDFADSGKNLSVTATTMDNAEYQEDGVVLNEGNWRFSKAASWTLFNFGSYIYLKVKAPETGTLVGDLYLCAASHAKAVFKLDTEKITFQDTNGDLTNLADFTPGTGWVEILFQRDSSVSTDYSNGAQNWFVKGGNLSAWTKLATTGTDVTTWLTASNTTGLQFSGSGCVNYCAVVEPTDTPAVDPVYYNSIEEIMEVDNVAPKKKISFNAGYTPENVSGSVTTTVPGDITYSDETGAYLLPTNGNTAFYYYEGTESKNYSPLTLDGTTAFVTKLKLANAGDIMVVQANKPGGNARAYIEVKATGITAAGSTHGGDATSNAENAYTTTNLEIGTDWVEVMMVANTGGYNVYAKSDSATDGKWLLTHTVSGWRYNRAGGISVSPTQAQYGGVGGAYVKDITVYRIAGKQYSTIDEIVGGSYATTYNFELDNNFAENMKYAATDGNEGITVNKGDADGTISGTYSADGWSGYQWQFLPHKGWEVFSDTTFLTFTAKTGYYFNIQTRGIGGNQLYIDFYSNGENYYRDANATKHVIVAPGSDWAEYLIKKSSTTSGYEVYIKQEAATGGKWEHIATAANFRTATTGVGITITPSANTAINWIKNVRVHTTNVATDAATKPAGATQLMYSDDFTAAPAYGSPAGSGVSFAEGNFVLTKGDGDAKGYWFNTEIPVGGYAEFRLNVGETCPTITFYDGKGSIGIYNRVGYGVVYHGGDGINLWSGDGGDTYRTWRVVRNTENTYSLYSKSDIDSAWVKVAENITSQSVDNSKHIYIGGTKTYAGEEGVAKIDYMRVYGPALTKDLTLTDGVGTVEVADGGVLAFPNAVRALVKQGDTARVLLFAEYDEETGILIKATHVVVPAGSDISSVMYDMDGKKVKVFLWDNASHANLVDVTNLTAK